MPQSCCAPSVLSPKLDLLHIDTLLIYGIQSVFTAPAQLNDYVFVSCSCQNYIMRLLKTKVLMCCLKLYKGVFYSCKWMASFVLCSSSVCNICILDLTLAGSVLWLCQAHQRLPGVNMYKRLIVYIVNENLCPRHRLQDYINSPSNNKCKQ